MFEDDLLNEDELKKILDFLNFKEKIKPSILDEDALKKE